jgi:hypothetical protein
LRWADASLRALYKASLNTITEPENERSSNVLVLSAIKICIPNNLIVMRVLRPFLWIFVVVPCHVEVVKMSTLYSSASVNSV